MSTFFEFLLDHLGLIIIVTVLCFVISAGAAILEAYIDTRKRPKAEMFWCHKHGYFKQEHALPLFPHLENPQFVCPVCYKEAVYDNVQVKG